MERTGKEISNEICSVRMQISLRKSGKTKGGNGLTMEQYQEKLTKLLEKKYTD